MKTNITINNYEAYLLDYMEGNLGHDETEQLKAFVAAQNLKWDELTQELPYLDAPAICYDNKESLKKKASVVPLYVKIASVAAAAGLLFTVSLWPEKQLPKLEPIAELKPIEASLIEMPLDLKVLPKKNICITKPQVVAKEKPVVVEKTEMPLLAHLEPQKPTILPTRNTFEEPDFDLIANRVNANLTFIDFAQTEENHFGDDEDEGRKRSLIKRVIYHLTNGRHDSVASLLNFGISKAKQDLTEAATDMALTAYQRADEHFEETIQRWEDRQGE